MKQPPSLSELVSLDGRLALITGAAAGIGRAIACRLAEAGADLELVDLDAKKLETVRCELEPFKRSVHLHATDIASKQAIDSLWDGFGKRLPDILVNNAGIYPSEHFLNVGEAFYRKIMATNLDGVFWMCQRMIRERMGKGGVIVNIGSIEAILPFKADLAHYSVSKAGVVALTRALAREHGRHGFRVNAVLPGGIITPGTKRVAQEIFQMKFELVKQGIDFRQRLPVGRLGSPDEVARIVLVLVGTA
jgi:NAD(P)-dependent dehydrogenase (short-subunit alcohol dehydrogenase family)